MTDTNNSNTAPTLEPTQWSTEEHPEGKFFIRRLGSGGELTAVAEMYVAACKNNTVTMEMTAHMYRMIHTFRGEKAVKNSVLKQVLKAHPTDKHPFALHAASNTLTDPKHIVGVEFASGAETTNFVQSHPEVVRNFLKSAAQHKAKVTLEKEKEKQKKKAATAAHQSPRSKKRRGHGATRITPPKAAKMPTSAEKEAEAVEAAKEDAMEKQLEMISRMNAKSVEYLMGKTDKSEEE